MKNARMLLVLPLIVAMGQSAIGQELSRRDQLRIAVQEICPVSGNKLGSHGSPVKVQVGKETVFLCCQGCVQGKINSQHWATIHANFARAQQICPVMKHKLPPNPKWVIVQGQIVFVCCPPCTEKISEQPETFLRKIDELYATSLQTSQDSQFGGGGG
jgi:hypothetical protein